METAQVRSENWPRDEQAGLSEELFIHLYQGQLERLYNFCRYRLGPAEAEDAAAAIIARAWSRRQLYDSARGSAESWLWAIARNVVTDQLRRRKPSAVLPEDLAAPGDLAVEIDQREEWRQLRAVLVQLAPLDQDIIALRFGAGYSNRAIAGLLHLREANVAQRLRRALRKMRVQLEGGEGR